jgi:hypothetical protein
MKSRHALTVHWQVIVTVLGRQAATWPLARAAGPHWHSSSSCRARPGPSEYSQVGGPGLPVSRPALSLAVTGRTVGSTRAARRRSTPAVQVHHHHGFKFSYRDTGNFYHWTRIISAAQASITESWSQLGKIIVLSDHREPSSESESSHWHGSHADTAVGDSAPFRAGPGWAQAH